MSTGSAVNYLMSGTKGQPEPLIGMGATILMYSDRHACTIVAINKKGNIIGVQRDKAERTDRGGMSDDQSYSYSPQTDAAIEYFRKRKNGAWIKNGEPMRNGTQIALGYRKQYYDYSR